jgi:adenine phosphoribosyltransferase
MSTSPEAILAREAGIDYAVIAMSTDYDCWKTTEEPVSWEEIKKVMEKNSNNVKKLLIKTIEKITNEDLTNNDLELIKSKIRTIPDFPKQGIMFRDITTLFQDPEAMKKTIEILHKRYKDKKIDYVAGIEARGFIIGGSLAEKLNCGFIPIRKKGKLPYEVEQQEYELEYGTDIIEIHKDALKSGQRILVVDDLIATGGTAKASCQLIEKLGGEIVECSFIIDLPELRGKEKLAKYPVFTLIEFEGN